MRSASASSMISGSSSSAACLIVTSRPTSVAISWTSSSERDWVAVRIWPSPIRILMIWDIGTPSAADRSLTVTPDSTVTGPVAGTWGCFGVAGVWAERSRAWRPSRPRALPPSITTRRRRPAWPPPRGRIGRFGLFGPSAMRLLSVETLEARLDRDGRAERAGESSALPRLLEAVEPTAGVGTPSRHGAARRQHAVHRPEAEERRLRRPAAAADACPDRAGVVTRRRAPPPAPTRFRRPRAPLRSRPRRRLRRPPRRRPPRPR